ncbi:MAG: hypothetical protein E7511_07135 [Ruminococcus sp.]|nr:hypothetical protein [Ruminococcus sp.]
MDGSWLLLLGLIAGIGGLLVYAVVPRRHDEGAKTLPVPFAVLPLADASPAVQKHLKQVLAQMLWMDSSIVHSLVLVYRAEDAETAALCRELHERYDFILCMTLPEAEALLTERLTPQKAAP